MLQEDDGKLTELRPPGETANDEFDSFFFQEHYDDALDEAFMCFLWVKTFAKS